MRQSYPRHLMVTALILVMLAAFLVGYRVRDYGSMKPAWAALTASTPTIGTLDNTVTLRPVELFKEALEQVQLNYVEPIEKPDELVYSAIRGMLLPLEDPYTRFMDPKEYAEFNTDNQGSLSGIGATLSMLEIPAQTVPAGEGMIPNITCPVCGTEIKDVKHYRVGIVEPLPGSPAKGAGLQSGDFILKVDGKDTEGKTVSEVAQQIRGVQGTKVTLTIARKGIEKPLDIDITRAHINVPSLEKKMLDDKIGYLHLLTFNEKTTIETREALQWMRKEGARGLVLDLRNNPGGLLRQCILVASMLLPETNKLIVETKTRSGRDEPYNRSGQQLWDQPIVVLVNKGSASASEILSGALKDYKRATIVGESTFGKALVQTVIPLSDRSAMAITTAHYYTPSGYDVGKKGVMPDIAVELAEDTKSLSAEDNQALEAIRILKTEMAKLK